MQGEGLTQPLQHDTSRDPAAPVDTGALTRTGANKATRYYLNIAITPLSSLDGRDIA